VIVNAGACRGGIVQVRARDIDGGIRGERESAGKKDGGHDG
jgi:hypothetical protein